MARLHLICRDRRHATKLGDGTIETGYWELYPPQAQRMVGNTIYLHKSRGCGAHQGGQVVAVRVATEGEPYPGRIVFRYRPIAEIRKAGWEGDRAARGLHGGIIE